MKNMKKVLGALTIFTVSSTAVTSVIACNKGGSETDNDKTPTETDLSKVKININDPIFEGINVSKDGIVMKHFDKALIKKYQVKSKVLHHKLNLLIILLDSIKKLMPITT